MSNVKTRIYLKCMQFVKLFIVFKLVVKTKVGF